MFGRTERLAGGAFESVRATAEGAATAFASRVADGGNTGIAWDLARRTPLGAPIPAFPGDRDEWTFGALPGPRGDTPVVAWACRGRLHVHDLLCGDEVVIDDADASFPDLLGLAVHEGRGAVVAVFDKRPEAEVAVWDARTAERLGTFEVWFGFRGAGFDRFLQHAAPAAGPLMALTCDTERLRGEESVDRHFVGVLDVERGRQVAELPSWGRRRAPMVPWRDGVVLVQPEPKRIVVRRPDGEELAVVDAPEGPEELAAARVGGRLLVAGNVPGEPGAFTVRDVARSEPLGRVEVPAPVHDVALAPDGTFLAATDDGLFAACVSGP